MSDLIAGRCLAPKNPTPMVTTEFCVYAKGHDGSHSWEHTAEARRARLQAERDALAAQERKA